MALRLHSSTYQALAAGMPLAALALSVLVIYPTWGRYQALNKEVGDLRVRLQELRDAPLPPPDPRLTAAEAVETEPPDFLREFTKLVRDSGCEIQGLQRVEVAGGTPLVRPVRTQVTLRGHYPRLRTFFWHAYRDHRLYAVTDVNITADAAGPNTQPQLLVKPLTARFILERYVTPPVGTVPAPPAG